MTEGLEFFDVHQNEFSAWPYENKLAVGVYNDYSSVMYLTRVQALRLAEYIGEVFSD